MRTRRSPPGTRAREAQAEAAAGEVLEVADEPTGTSEDEARRRVRVDARKWYASKVLPRVYGERAEHAHTGAVDVHVRYEDERRPPDADPAANTPPASGAPPTAVPPPGAPAPPPPAIPVIPVRYDG